MRKFEVTLTVEVEDEELALESVESAGKVAQDAIMEFTGFEWKLKTTDIS